MDLTEFGIYLGNFETTLGEAMLSIPPERIYFKPDRQQKLHSTNLAWILDYFPLPSQEIFAIDYYGYFRYSMGFESLKKQLRNAKEGQIRFISCPVVHFSSIRIEEVAAIDPSLVAAFPAFKSRILELRGFQR